MERRTFLQACAAAALAQCHEAQAQAGQAGPVRRYARSLLVDARGEPIKARALAARRNYLFNYPYVATPCFLLNLGQPLRAVFDLIAEDGGHYALKGGVGPDAAIVSYSAICAHKLAYPTHQITFIRFQSAASARSDANRIHCCAEHSIYDPTQGARVVGGPAKQPLAAIVLDYDRERDALYAIGTAGGELFDVFFAKYDFQLALEYGQGKGRQPTGATTVVQEINTYCRQTIDC